MGDAVPNWIRATNYELQQAIDQGTSSPIKSSVPGRTDQIHADVPAGAYVMPADVVSGLGEGNTMAGSAIIDRMLHSMPHGTKGENLPRGAHFPAATPMRKYAAGGAPGNKARIVVAGGEYIVHPNDVLKIGRGDLNAGHEILDNFVKTVRADTVAKLKKLPGPKK